MDERKMFTDETSIIEKLNLQIKTEFLNSISNLRNEKIIVQQKNSLKYPR